MNNLITVGFTGVIAFFTALLWCATRKYTKITEELLKQSWTEFEQSKRALITDVVDRTIQYTLQLVDNNGIDTAVEYFVGKMMMIAEIDEKIAKEIDRALVAWEDDLKYKKFIDRYREAIIKYRQRRDSKN